MRIRHLVEKFFPIVHPHAGIDSIESSLKDNSFSVVLDEGVYLGILTPSDIIESPHQLVIDCVHDKPLVDTEQDIESVLRLMKESRNSVLPVFKDGEFIGVITQTALTDYLLEYRNELKQKISEHTAKLKSEIFERKQADEALRKAKESLEQTVEERTSALKMKNIALSELLDQVEHEKKQIARRVAVNVEKLLLPIIKKQKSRGSSLDTKYLDLIEYNLNELTSSFGEQIASIQYNLTPREIEICNLIKKGVSGKEIAELLHLSFGTVESHRSNIRKKFNITGKKINLGSFLNNL